jgi:hypothetical protein
LFFSQQRQKRKRGKEERREDIFWGVLKEKTQSKLHGGSGIWVLVGFLSSSIPPNWSFQYVEFLSS